MIGTMKVGLYYDAVQTALLRSSKSVSATDSCGFCELKSLDIAPCSWYDLSRKEEMHMTIEVASRLCAYRKQRGLSQEELAAQVGVSRQAVSKWERAEASPDTDNLIQLARIYQITLDELLNLDPTEAKEEITTPVQESEPNEMRKEELTREEQLLMEIRDLQRERARRLRLIPFPIICVLAYLIFGFTGWCGGWAWGWQVFLSIPLYYTLVDAVEQSNPSCFAYPVLAAWLFFWLGTEFGLWHPAWLVFLTIPVYYGIAEAVKR